MQLADSDQIQAIMSQFVRRRGRAIDPAVAALGDPEDVNYEDVEAAQEADEDCEAADDAEIDCLEQDNLELVLDADNIKFGLVAIKKVHTLPRSRHGPLTLTETQPDHKSIPEGLAQPAKHSLAQALLCIVEQERGNRFAQFGRPTLSAPESCKV